MKKIGENVNIFVMIWRWLNDTCPECGADLTWEPCDDEYAIDDEVNYVGICTEHGEVR